MFDPPGDDRFVGSAGASFVRLAQRKAPRILSVGAADDDAGAKPAVPATSPAFDTAFSAALARAWKRDFVEAGVEGTRNMLLECQRSTSAVLAMPFMRSDAQQSHCFRF